MSRVLNKAVKSILPKSWRRVLDDAASISENLASQEWMARKLAVVLMRQRHPELFDTQTSVPDINHYELRVCSQSGEDGILAYIFSKVHLTNRRFVEFGAGDGLECNTANLAINFGWRGLLLDSEPQNVEAARIHYQQALKTASPNVKIAQCLVTADNINPTLASHEMEGEIDLLSIDIDGNDYWVWKAIAVISPRVVVIEYNALLGDERSLVIRYEPSFKGRDWQNYGASLAALAKLANAKGYILVGCESRGVNAFFVRRDVAEGKIFEVSVRDAYRPSWWLERLARSSIPIKPVQYELFVEV